MRSAQALTPQDVLDKFKEDRLHALSDRESQAQEQRRRLRDSVVQLREPSEHASAPASTSQPTFKIGDAKGFPHVSERGETSPGNGHLSKQGADQFYSFLKEAASKQDSASREVSVGKAAKTVVQDWLAKHGLAKRGHEGLVSTVLHEARAQAVFSAQEIGKKLGLNPVQSSVIGYSLERALEKQGFKVFASHAIDRSAEFFKATASSVAASAGLRHSAEATLSKSMNWMATHGVTREALKDALGKHAGKLSVLTELAHHPEALQRAVTVLSKSDKVLDGVMLLAKDNEFRKAVGTLTLAAGETAANFNKGVGSVAILAGSALRGDSSEETARHAFRAALSVAGGAAGGLVGAGFLSVATGTAGAMAGSALADKVLEVYDRHMGRAPNTQVHTVHRDEVNDSARVVAGRVANRMQEEGKHLVEAGKVSPIVAARGQEMAREYSMGRPMPGAKS